MIVYLMSPKEKNSIHGEKKNNRIYNKKNPPTIEKKRHLIGQDIMEEYLEVINEIISTSPEFIINGIKILVFHNDDTEHMFKNNSTNH